MNPLAAIKTVWADKKKRPFVAAGAGMAAGAAWLAFKRPSDPQAAASEDQAAADATAPSDVAGLGGSPIDGQIPTVYTTGSGYGPDPAFMESDLSSVYAAIDQGTADQAKRIDDMWHRERQKSRRIRQRVQHQAQTNDRQAKQIERQKKRIARVRHRVKVLEQKGRKKKPVKS